MPTLHLKPNRCSLLVVELRIRGIPHNFIVDTGASDSTINSDLLPVLTNVQSYRTLHTSANGIKDISYTTDCPFQFAGVRLTRINVSTVGHNLTPTIGFPVSGLIGQDLLRKFKRVVVDYTRNTISFES